MIRVLSDRRQRILQALIEEYVANALPVGSRTLTERYQLGVSSATIRNELSVLEEEGYIAQPHTSAGRVPTDIGYRAFVDDLLAAQAIPDDPRYADYVEELKSVADEMDVLLERMSSAVSKLTGGLGLVVPPDEGSKALQCGMSTLAAQPEFARTRELFPIIRVLEDDTMLLEVLHDGLYDEDTAVHIGSENAAEGFSGVSVVASRFGTGSGMGVVAVIGPTRMDYSNAIRAVKAASTALDGK